MKRLARAMRFVIAAEMVFALAVLAQGNYKVEPAGAPPAELPKILQDALQPAGTRLVNDQGAPVCEVWLRKSVPTQQGGGSSDVLYANLSLGTMVGVLRFPNAGSDFRGQPIKAGVYTMRYAQIPQDGNHMGVSSYRDFLLLEPAGSDAEFDKPQPFDVLVKLSRQASGTGHPAVLSLDPATQGQPNPSVARDDQGHWALQVNVAGKSAAGEQQFPLNIVLVGKTEAG